MNLVLNPKKPLLMMAEFIPEAVPASENDSKTVEVKDYDNETLFGFPNLDRLIEVADEYANWVHFGVGGPA